LGEARRLLGERSGLQPASRLAADGSRSVNKGPRERSSFQSHELSRALPVGSPTGTWERWQRRVRAWVAGGRGTGLFRWLLPPLDLALLSLSGGRWSVTSWGTGLPVAMVLVADGSGSEFRKVPLVVVPDEGSLVLVASNFGSQKHPRWYRALASSGEADVVWQGERETYAVEVLAGQARQRAWSRAETLFAGYTVYADMAGGRQIPLLRLTPAAGRVGGPPRQEP
jgi:deazaflavin-dependent oxidoreductase (nitroreductase family)